MERRLAAILAADVVGYSRLMEQDEAGTLAMLKSRRREVLEPLVAKHQGRVFKVTGDGALVEFASAVNAVQCAVDLQQGMAAANSDQPDHEHIVLRIGVNLGDVMVEGSDLYGDGINIAARLEGIAEPGGILVSGTAYDHIRNKVKVGFDDLGSQSLKNIAEPVRIYRVVGTPTVPIAATRATSDKPSIAVLPFANMSGDPEQQYFSDGITEDIITELSRFRSLFVIARNSSFQYREQAVDVRHVARELGVQYVVEGSVRKASGHVRITAQLIDAATGNHLWVERYDRPLEDIFVVQDEVVHKVAARLEGRLVTRLVEQARRKPTQSMTAYEYVLRAREDTGLLDGLAAESLLRSAIKLDPSYAQAYAWLSWSIIIRYFDDPRPELLNEALSHGRRAVALEETDGVCHCLLATTHLFRHEFDAAGAHFERALALNPVDVLTIAHWCHWLFRIGRHEEALAGLDDVLQRDPFPPSWYWEVRAMTLLGARRYRDAIESLDRMSVLRAYNHALLAACQAQLGQMEQAKREVTEALLLSPDFTIGWAMLTEPFKFPGDAEPMIEGMRKAGLPE
jgi:adenylate cyclase